MNHTICFYFSFFMLLGQLISRDCIANEKNQNASRYKTSNHSDGDSSRLENEPAIQGLTLEQTLTLKGGSIILNEHLSPNSEITTQAGMKQFFSQADGVLVKNSGLYRVSFFQRVFSKIESRSSCLVSLLLTPGNYGKRYQTITLEPNAGGEINFTQILRINGGQKIQLVLRHVSGEIILGSRFESSGLTIEQISP